MSGESIRDLIVSIDFSDIDVSTLTLIDNAIDEIEDQLQAMGHEINDASHEFSQMGVEGLLAANAIEAALEDVEDAAEDASHEVNGLGNAFALATLKVGLFGTAGVAAFAGILAAGAPLLLVAGGLAASFAAAGIGAVAFGAVATGAFKEMFKTQEDIKKLEDKIAKENDPKKKAELQKDLKEVYKSVSKAQRGALKELESFQSFWGGFVKKFETPVFKAFGTTLSIVKQVLKGLEPTITAVSGVVNDLLTNLNQDIKSGGMKEFFDWLSTNAAGALQSFATIGGNALSGVFSLIQAFAPIGATMEQGLVGLSEKFKIWAAGLSESQGFQSFVDYAMTNGPILLETIGNIWDIFKNLVTDLAPFGTTVLTALQSFTSLIADNWPAIKETIIGIGTAAAAFAVIMKGWQIIGAINALMIAFRTGTVAATLAQWGLNAAMLANPITWVIAGIAALIAIGVLLYRNWDTVKAKAVELWNKTKEVFANIGHWIVEKMQPVIDFFGRLKDKWDSFVNSIKNFKMPKIGIPKMFGGNGLIQKPDGSHATGLSNVPFDGYRALLHKGEAVLTAKQSDALRAAGILNTSGKKPSLNAGASVTPTGRMKSGSNVFSPSITIQVNGASGDSNEIAKKAAYAAKRELEKLFTQLGLAYE